MVERFASWCSPCRSAIPHIAQMTKDFPDAFIVSVSDEDVKTVEKLKGQMPMMAKYNVALD